ncbi:MAG: 4-hydroxybenzoate 3-monooxygenase [Myxococcota bacterium]
MARTCVGIVGAGPAGLVLAHLLAEQGVESVVLERQSRSYVERRVRAGLLEHGTLSLLERHGLAERLLAQGQPHRGVELRFDGARHRIAYAELTGGRHMMVYPQQDLVADLIRLWIARGGEIAFGAEEVTLHGLDGARPEIRWTAGARSECLECDFVAGCDGFHGVSRAAIPPGALTVHDQRLPFAWVGVLAQVAPSTEEIVYANHERGFAGHMLRSATVSRFYLQTEPDDPIESWPDARIWQELQQRLATRDGWRLREGPVLEKSVTDMRSFVVEPMQFGRLFLAGDSAHIVPPTGAKGMNLAVADALVLGEALARRVRSSDSRALDGYSSRCLHRVWRVQEFSSWMSWLIHRIPDATPDAELRRRLQRSQLEYLCSSTAAAASFAENYVGLPESTAAASAPTTGGP